MAMHIHLLIFIYVIQKKYNVTFR